MGCNTLLSQTRPGNVDHEFLTVSKHLDRSNTWTHKVRFWLWFLAKVQESSFLANMTKTENVTVKLLLTQGIYLNVDLVQWRFSMLEAAPIQH